MFTMDTMEAPEQVTGKDGEEGEPSHVKLEDMIKELGTALTGKQLIIVGSVLVIAPQSDPEPTVHLQELFVFLFQVLNMNKNT